MRILGPEMLSMNDDLVVQAIRFRLRSSANISCSSCSFSAVSAGFRSECTFEAILDRLVGGPVSFLAGNLDPLNDHPLSADVTDVLVSLVRGGVVCLELTEGRCPFNSYCANTWRTSCGLSPCGVRPGEGGH
jgi:hypothetical protein